MLKNELVREWSGEELPGKLAPVAVVGVVAKKAFVRLPLLGGVVDGDGTSARLPTSSSDNLSALGFG